MAYSDKVVEHYENPRNVGSFDMAMSRWEPEWLARPHVATS